jgi:hypothetical protein
MIVRRFNRYELKYVVHIRKVAALMKDLREMTVPDAHSGPEGYRITSLYYDSPNLDFYWAKLDGLKFRRKLRLRIYPGQALIPGSIKDGHVEIKQRINRTVQKRRLVLPLAEAEQLCAGSIERTDLDELDQQVASEVQYLVHAMHLRPTAVISYRRFAFEGGRYDTGLRITFDVDLRARVHALKVDECANDHLFMPPDMSVMEVKANDAIPDWVTYLLARHDCQLQRVSKYCAGLKRARSIRTIPQTIWPQAGQGA